VHQVALLYYFKTFLYYSAYNVWKFFDSCQRPSLDFFYDFVHFLYLCTDGMPIYEGDDRIWQHYKVKIERQAVAQLHPRNNPLMLIMEYFPDVQVVEGPDIDGSVFSSARLVFTSIYLRNNKIVIFVIISGLHHYECIAPLTASNLQSRRFWAIL